MEEGTTFPLSLSVLYCTSLLLADARLAAQVLRPGQSFLLFGDFELHSHPIDTNPAGPSRHSTVEAGKSTTYFTLMPTFIHPISWAI
jgi:hypothetical protein